MGLAPTPYETDISVHSDWLFLGSCYHPPAEKEKIYYLLDTFLISEL